MRALRKVSILEAAEVMAENEKEACTAGHQKDAERPGAFGAVFISSGGDYSLSRCVADDLHSLYAEAFFEYAP